MARGKKEPNDAPRAPKKTKLAPVLRKMETYEGRAVMMTTLQVTNAGDGLSQAMAIEPVLLHHHDTVFVVLECEVSKVHYEPIPETPDLERKHTLKAGRATIVEKDLVIDALNAQAERIQAAKDAQVGQGTLDPNMDMKGNHLAGYHDDVPNPDCPDCQAATQDNKQRGRGSGKLASVPDAT